MRYKNTKTGVVMSSPCIIKGGDWVELDEAREEEQSDVAVLTLSEMTIASLKKFAAENDIDLGTATKKDDIIKVIMESDAVEIE